MESEQVASLRLGTACFSRVGGRSTNEDSVITATLGTAALVAVADGMGGHAGGHTASRASLLPFRGDSIDGQGHDDRPVIPTHPSELESWLRESCLKANDSVRSKLRRNGEEGGGTTLAVAVVTPRSIGVLSVGDTRVYKIGQEIEQITSDHTVIAERRASGASYDELVHSRYRDALSRSLGTDPAPEPFVSVWERESERFWLLACTDGVYGPLTRGEIQRIAQENSGDLEAIAKKLTEAAVEKDATDNATAGLIQVEPRLSTREDSRPQRSGDD